MFFDIVFLVLAGLFIKHYICDFVLQTDTMVKEKGTYGAKGGIEHAITHAVGTFAVIIWIFDVQVVYWAIIMSVLDGVLHYHIDYVKMRWGCRDPQQKAYWRHLGLDQLAHSLTYLFIIWSLI